MSSGEAEYYGMVRGGAEALGTKSIMADLGLNTSVKLMTDSSAAKAIAMRTGLGKVRHIEVNQLWLQEKIRNGEIHVVKVDGTKNLADALTKHVGMEELQYHIGGTNCKIGKGRHSLAPEVTYENRSPQNGEEEEDEDQEMEGTGGGDNGWSNEERDGGVETSGGYYGNGGDDEEDEETSGGYHGVW